jgi:hypothetical protein
MRLRRLAKLKHRPRLLGDLYDAATPLWAALDASADAERAGRMFTWLPPEPLSSEAEERLEGRAKPAPTVLRKTSQVQPGSRLKPVSGGFDTDAAGRNFDSHAAGRKLSALAIFQASRKRGSPVPSSSSPGRNVG